MKRVKARLKELGWSDADLAREMGMKQPQLSVYLIDSGRPPTFPVLERFAIALRKPASWLLDDGRAADPAQPLEDHDLEECVRRVSGAALAAARRRDSEPSFDEYLDRLLRSQTPEEREALVAEMREKFPAAPLPTKKAGG